MTSSYLFSLGFACGLTVLAITSVRRIGPRWLRWLLITSLLLVIARYTVMALFANPALAQQYWFLHRLWFGSIIGLTLPSLFAVDQLLRHPAMTPRKLLRWYTPFFVVFAAVMLGGRTTAVVDTTVGWTVHLSFGWKWLLMAAQGVFVVGFVAVCFQLMLKITNRPIQMGLLFLALGQACLGLESLFAALGESFKPFFFSEMFMLLGIWWAYETASTAPETA